MNITESRDEAFEGIAEMLRSNVRKSKIAAKLSADYCVSDKTVYKWINKVEIIAAKRAMRLFWEMAQ